MNTKTLKVHERSGSMLPAGRQILDRLVVLAQEKATPIWMEVSWYLIQGHPLLPARNPPPVTIYDYVTKKRVTILWHCMCVWLTRRVGGAESRIPELFACSEGRYFVCKWKFNLSSTLAKQYVVIWVIKLRTRKEKINHIGHVVTHVTSLDIDHHDERSASIWRAGHPAHYRI